MESSAPERKLAAILSADVSGYSLLMGRDEASTVDTLTEYRAVIVSQVERQRGRIVDAKGDAILAEFASVVNAVSCAVEVQRELAERNQRLPIARRMQFRIGVNLGDVIVKDEAIYGDGVNVAARIETLASPGGICISRLVYDYVKNKLPLSYEYLGRKSVKNIAELVEVYRVSEAPPGALPKARTHNVWPRSWRKAVVVSAIALAIGAAVLASVYRLSRPSTSPREGPTLTALDKPSIVILPFDNLSGDPKQNWLSDGLTETLITDLAKLSNLYVIARNSAFTYKGKPVDVRKIGQELGVRYVLEGSVQKTGARIRINAQLNEAATGRHLWAERYDRAASDIFDIQDDITRRIVTELDVTLLEGEQVRVWRRATRSREAYEIALRARDTLNRFTKEDTAQALALNLKALEIDPNFTWAMVGIGYIHITQADAGWSADPMASYEQAIAWGRRAIRIDDALGDAHTVVATALLSLRRHREAMAEFEKALAVGPNDADHLVMIGWGFAQNGRAEEALVLIKRALRLNPFPHEWVYGAQGDALLFANHAEEAIPVHRKCVDRVPDFIWCQFGLTADYVLTGRIPEAQSQAKEILRINPKVTAEENTYVASIGGTRERQNLIEALRKAGLK